MGHMVPTTEYMVAYHVGTDCGTEIVPLEVCGSIDVNMANASEAELASVFELVLRSYCVGSRIMGDIDRKEGWYSRLSAPGYLDCTEWDGPYDSANEALEACKAEYDVDNEGDDNDNS